MVLLLISLHLLFLESAGVVKSLETTPLLPLQAFPSLPSRSIAVRGSVSSSVGQRRTRTSPEVPFAIPALGKLMAGPGWVNVDGKSCGPRRHRGCHLAQVMSGAVGFQGSVSPRAEQHLPRVDVVLLRTWSAHLSRPSHSGPQESAYSQLWLTCFVSE